MHYPLTVTERDNITTWNYGDLTVTAVNGILADTEIILPVLSRHFKETGKNTQGGELRVGAWQEQPPTLVEVRKKGDLETHIVAASFETPSLHDTVAMLTKELGFVPYTADDTFRTQVEKRFVIDLYIHPTRNNKKPGMVCTNRTDESSCHLRKRTLQLIFGRRQRATTSSSTRSSTKTPSKSIFPTTRKINKKKHDTTHRLSRRHLRLAKKNTHHRSNRRNNHHGLHHD
ncbi:MAG TPA: hypothetical protein VJB87_00245 [Candidatus Nanoarchaeia archaeon]|nr:hypothetical protein [Candidatus Nanoarchaeia archaeon]